jgi:hypothetical protein
MSTKKKKPAPSSNVRGPVERDGATHLHREDLLYVELLQAKTFVAFQGLALQKREHEAMLLRHAEEIRASQSTIATLKAQAQELETKTASVWTEMGDVYGLDFHIVSYDDETGRLTVHERT